MYKNQRFGRRSVNIGFIGIGQMGKHMSRRVLEAGYQLTVHDLRKEAAYHLLEKGAKWADTPKAVAESCEIVLSSLPGPPEVDRVVYGVNGLMAGWKKGDIYIDMSTNSPTTMRRIAQDAQAMGVTVLDAPVSGLPSGAEAGTLVIMVGGNAQCLERVRKVLEVIGNKIFHMGDVGCGNITKLVNNLLSTTCTAINAEGFVLGAKAGIDVSKLWEVIRVSPGNNWVLEHLYPQTVFRGNFDPGFRLSLACKDIGLALALGKEYDVPMPVGAAVEQTLLEAKAAGLGDRGIHSIVLRLEELAGAQVRSPDR